VTGDPLGRYPLSCGEIVKMVCAPANARVNQAWDECVAAAKLAKVCNQVALTLTERAVHHVNLSRQLLTIARLQGTVPLYQAPERREVCQTPNGKR
jgi:hypothetical protein